MGLDTHIFFYLKGKLEFIGESSLESRVSFVKLQLNGGNFLHGKRREA
jgi:hypothetical protein